MLGECGFLNFEFYFRMEVIHVSVKIIGFLFVFSLYVNIIYHIFCMVVETSLM